MRLAALAAAAALAPAVAAAQAGAASAAGCERGSGLTRTTASYVMVLSVGPMEAMYTPAQARAKHPKHGEIMLGGAMTPTGGMAMGKSVRHLEVQICSRTTGKVVADASPAITLADESGMGMHMAQKVPVAMMVGVGESRADMHYGNNVQMPAGHSFTVTVTLKGERAVFRLRVR